METVRVSKVGEILSLGLFPNRGSGKLKNPLPHPIDLSLCLKGLSTHKRQDR